MAKNINNILIPNVTKTGGQKKVDVSNRLSKIEQGSEFKNLLSEIDGNGFFFNVGKDVKSVVSTKLVF